MPWCAVGHLPGSGASSDASPLANAGGNAPPAPRRYPSASSSRARTTIACDHSSGDAEAPQRRVQ